MGEAPGCAVPQGEFDCLLPLRGQRASSGHGLYALQVIEERPEEEPHEDRHGADHDDGGGCHEDEGDDLVAHHTVLVSAYWTNLSATVTGL